MAQDSQSDGGAESGIVETIWQLLTSIRVALGLILALTLAVLAGTLIEQAPSYAILNTPVFQQWLQTVQPKYGFATGLMAILGFFNVFQSPLFASLLGLLSLNVIICTIDRWPRIWRLFRRPSVPVEARYFDTARLTATLRLPPSETETTAARLKAALSQRGYRVRSTNESGHISLYADRYAWSRFGTLLNHAGIVLVLAGAVVGSVLGFRIPGFMIPEGSARAIGHGTNLYASLDSFMEESYPDGRPKDYWSEVILFDGATQVARQVVRVNEPLVYRTGPLGWQEIRFHQSSFGNAVSLTVADENGKEIFNDAVALSFSDPDFGHRPAGYLDLRNQGVVLEVVGRMASITDPGLEAGDILVQVNRVMGDVIRPVDMAKLSMRQPKKVGNLTITFQRERPYSGLQVVYDPGNRIIWLACTLIILGIILVFYFPVRRLRAMCVADNGGFTVRITGISERGPGFDENFRRLVESLKAELGGRFEGGSVAPR